LAAMFGNGFVVAIVVLWFVTSCGHVCGTSMYEEHISIHPQNGGYTSLRNAGNYLQGDTAPQLTRPQPTKCIFKYELILVIYIKASEDRRIAKNALRN
jgi:hypothetical protein